ncbi:DUF3299 domain-containing protein [Sulfitobacter sp. D35]|uniref:DUF3299 domain-containing protein n=1 Tax=Sulfitobacter sp. D35 TaxID=3083252 RepID=UPI00296FE0FB|nr:DUF3299 domain-containing protein [Sulfitobacter sp. D35]MDW4498859.1 DUF3299 domain-containing protein [Sulfitobacter sp. D35]
MARSRVRTSGTRNDVAGPNRRTFATGLAASVALAGASGAAEETVELDWADLVPPGQPQLPPDLQGLVPHDESAMASLQAPSTGVRTDWNGRIVRLSGFIVPLDFEGTGVAAFLLVPYVGACVHVPPPPANQLVLVTARPPYAYEGLFEPVTVTGMFGTASTSTQLADVGYALSADRIDPFEG